MLDRDFDTDTTEGQLSDRPLYLALGIIPALFAVAVPTCWFVFSESSPTLRLWLAVLLTLLLVVTGMFTLMIGRLAYEAVRGLTSPLEPATQEVPSEGLALEA